MNKDFDSLKRSASSIVDRILELNWDGDRLTIAEDLLIELAQVQNERIEYLEGRIVKLEGKNE